MSLFVGYVLDGCVCWLLFVRCAVLLLGVVCVACWLSAIARCSWSLLCVVCCVCVWGLLAHYGLMCAACCLVFADCLLFVGV